MKRNKPTIALGIMAAFASAAAHAHHSQALFDMSRCQTLVGTVQSFQLQFPHSWLWVVVPNGKGGMDTWGLESSAPAQMTEVDKRWKRDVVKKGDKISVKISPMKDGRTGGALATLTLPNGTTLRAATPACAKEMKPPSPAAGASK
jgi:Family of unknown function (DUF6152)